MEAKYKKYWPTGMREPRRKIEVEDLPIKRNIFSLRREFYNSGLNLMTCYGENSETTMNSGVNQREVLISAVLFTNCVTPRLSPVSVFSYAK